MTEQQLKQYLEEHHYYTISQHGNVLYMLYFKGAETSKEIVRQMEIPMAERIRDELYGYFNNQTEQQYHLLINVLPIDRRVRHHVSPAAWKIYKEIIQHPGIDRTAIVLQSNKVMAHLIQTMLSPLANNLVLFNDIEPARKWLNMDAVEIDLSESQR